MKKLLRFKKQRKTTGEHTARITNETVAEHRERIIAGGRRFKYPVQYARHKLVINTIVISTVALVVSIGLVWWQLYSQQNSSTFFYRITKVMPLPVASVDDQPVRYSDYLLAYRSQAHYLEFKEGVNLRSKENKERVNFMKRQALNDAIADAYAEKLAKEHNITVSETEVDKAIERQRRSRDGLASQETYDAIILDHFDWTPEEARSVTARKLLRQEVAYKIDDQATEKRNRLEEKLKTETDFDKIAASLGGKDSAKVSVFVTPLVPRSNQDGGLALAAGALQKGQTSKIFKSTSGDGYYVVRLLDVSGADQISYSYIRIPLTKLDAELKKVRQDGKVKEYINVPAEPAKFGR